MVIGFGIRLVTGIFLLSFKNLEVVICLQNAFETIEKIV